MTIELPLLPHEPTFYNRHGDWFGWGCVCVSLLLIAGRLTKRNARSNSGCNRELWRQTRRHVSLRIVAGTLNTRLPNGDWKGYGKGQFFVVPPKVKFEVKA